MFNECTHDLDQLIGDVVDGEHFWLSFVEFLQVIASILVVVCDDGSCSQGEQLAYARCSKS